ncbi:hypothetical protein LNV47_22580 [Paucibacter sp. DJ4R-1]|nr:hypothetical protein [Paucibacter sp. DJ4R-1]
MSAVSLLALIPTFAAAAVRSSVLSADEREAELAPGREALAAISRAAETGSTHSFDLTAWEALVDVANVAEQLAGARIASNLADDIDLGQQILAEMIVASRLSAGRWLAGRAQVPPLKQLLWVYDVQLQHCSRGELEEARARVRTMARQALAGHAPPGVIVHEASAPVAQERRQR